MQIHGNIPSLENTLELITSGQLKASDAASHLFSPGYELDRSGKGDAALSFYQSTIAALENYLGQGNKLSQIEYARLAVAHGVNLFQLGRLGGARASFKSAVDTYNSILEWGIQSSQTEELATALRWLGLCQRVCGDFRSASKSYRRSLVLFRYILTLATSFQKQRLYEQALSATLLGYSKTLKKRGKRKLSRKFKTQALFLLEKCLTERFTKDVGLH